MKKLIKSISVLMLLTLSCLSFAQKTPLQVLSKADYSDLTQKEKEIYVTGVLEGQAFILYGSNSPDLKTFTECIKKEGIKTLTMATETAALFDEPKNPMPWSVAKAVGTVCKKYR
jgi:hypothetical protein